VAVLFPNESEILRKVRFIEGLKAGIVTCVGQLYEAMAQNSEQAIRQKLAAIVVSCFVLGRRVGVDFAAMDQAILEHLEDNINKEHEAEKWFGDFSDFRRHIRQKR
jgi:hypothetical protein